MFLVAIVIILVLFVLIFVWLFASDDIGAYRVIRGFSVEVFWTYSAHSEMVRPVLGAEK